jgi:regulator of sigma E protease
MFQMIMGLGAVIFVHELGHFLVAKMCGVKCDKFYVGFDAFDIKIGDRVIIPKSLLKYQWGETEYGIGIMPFGGYVKMLGQDDNPANMEAEIKRSMADGEEVTEAMSAGLIDRDKMDPRSYLAKSVVQRMMIISAGVIFNLAFAVLFAALAFKAGVNYQPPSIGTVVGGGPAWENNLVGADIKRIGKQQVQGNYFTQSDMANEIVFNGDSQPLEFEIQRYNQSETSTLEVTPRKGIVRSVPDLAFIGSSARLEPIVGKQGAIEGNTAFKASPAFEPGDRIVEINGTKIETDIDLRHVLMRDADKVASFTLQRTAENGATETVKTDVQPNPFRRFGFGLTWDKITALQKGSPAVQAGLKVGDEILAVNGQSRGDLLVFDRQLIKMARQDQSVQLTILRDGAQQTIDVKPVVPNVASNAPPFQVVPIDALGIAVGYTNVIETIEPGTPAEASGLQVGDEITTLEFLLTEDQKKDDPSLDGEVIDVVDGDANVVELVARAQTFAPGTKIRLKVVRDVQEKSIELESFASKEYYSQMRGISLTALEEHYQATTWSDAFSLGLKQVRNDATRVLTFLKKLITGKVSPKNLGGPGTIAVVATSEASQGTSRLLLFLTLLSANLAVVNFLPIPVLDGGHMMFLAYEGLFRRPVTPQVQNLLMLFGFVFIIGLMLFVVAMDIGRISKLF